MIPWSPLAGGWLIGPLPQGAADCRSLDARERLPARYDMTLPGNQRKLEAADALAALARGGRDHPDRAGARVRRSAIRR